MCCIGGGFREIKQKIGANSMQRIKDRVTVKETVYHQQHGRNPQVIESKFCHDLETTEQLYERHLQVTEEWQPLDCGWLKDKVGMLIIQNDEGQFLSVNPSEEERLAAAKKTVEIKYDRYRPKHIAVNDFYSCWLIPPGESMRARPSHASGLSIRCQSGVAEITLYLIPK